MKELPSPLSHSVRLCCLFPSDRSAEKGDVPVKARFGVRRFGCHHYVSCAPLQTMVHLGGPGLSAGFDIFLKTPCYPGAQSSVYGIKKKVK